jgi:hypothetical protein
MATIVLAGSGPNPVRHEGWDASRGDVSRPLPTAPSSRPRGTAAPNGRGQGGVWEPVQREGLVRPPLRPLRRIGLVLTAPSP